jgi:hypothetical protein
MQVETKKALDFVKAGAYIQVLGGPTVDQFRASIRRSPTILRMINYSYTTSELERWHFGLGIENFRQQNYGRMAVMRNSFVAISPNYVKLCESRYVDTEAKDDSTGLSETEFLYSKGGIGTAMTSQNNRKALGVDPGWDDTFQVLYTKNVNFFV